MQLGDGRSRGIRLIDDPLRVRIQETAGWCEADTPRRSLQHLHAEPGLEVGDRTAHRRLRNSQRARRGREAIQIHDLREDGKLSRGPDQIQGGSNIQGSRLYCFTQEARRPSFSRGRIRRPLIRAQPKCPRGMS